MSQAPKPINKLLVTFTLSPEHPISEDNIDITFILKNIGDSAFSGGKMTELTLIFSDNTSISVTQLLEIPSIPVGESRTLSPYRFNASTDGRVWIRFALKPTEEVEIHLFQNPVFDMGTVWGNAFRVKKLEHVEIVNLLNKIIELLEKKKETE